MLKTSSIKCRVGGLGPLRVNIVKGLPVLDFELWEINGIRCQITSIFSIGEISKSPEGQVLAESEEGLEKVTGKKLVGGQQTIN